MTANPMTPKQLGRTPARSPGERRRARRGRPLINWPAVRPVDVAALAAVAAALGWAYAPNLASLVRTWNREPDYSHGFLVLPIALVILWKTWPADPEAAPRPWLARAGSLVVAALAARACFHERGQTWSETATLLPAVAGLALARLGWRTMSADLAGVRLPGLPVPAPAAGQLRALAAAPVAGDLRAPARSLRLTGLWVMPEGNVILVGNERLEVAAACNGLSMLMSLAATVAATASLVPMANWKRVGPAAQHHPDRAGRATSCGSPRRPGATTGSAPRWGASTPTTWPAG